MHQQFERDRDKNRGRWRLGEIAPGDSKRPIMRGAMGTQVEIARQFQAQGGDYLLCLKANHPTLHDQVKTWFEQAHAT